MKGGSVSPFPVSPSRLFPKGLDGPGIESDTMAERISRREFAKRGVGIAAVATIGSLASAGQASKDSVAEVAGDMAAVEKKLAKPLSKEARELTVKALTNNRAAVQDRYKFELPENSEPCTIFHVRKGK